MALGRSYVVVGEPESAIALFERILLDVEHAEPFDAGLFVRFSTYLSYALADVGDTGAARRVIMRAAPHAEGLIDTYAQIRLIWSLARMHGLKGEAAVAARHYERAIAMLEARDDNDHLGLAHLGAATVYMDSGGLDEAAQHLDAAERVLSDPDERAHAKVERARLLYLRGDAEQAHELALAALDELDSAPDGAHETGRAWATLAQIQAAIGSDTLAEQSYLTALDNSKQAPPQKPSPTPTTPWPRFYKNAAATARPSPRCDTPPRHSAYTTTYPSRPPRQPEPTTTPDHSTRDVSSTGVPRTVACQAGRDLAGSITPSVMLAV